MPTTYTHDAFGKEVYKRLDEELKEIIQSARSLYLIGLHGPDILFYYHPFTKNKIKEKGYQLHQEIAAPFFGKGISLYHKHHSKRLAAYLFGFSCHYILDSACHPYVREFERITGISHAEIESELDRTYMQRDGRNPFTYQPAVSICATTAGNQVVSQMFPTVSPKKIGKSLSYMRFYTNAMVCNTERKRNFLLRLFKIMGCYSTMEGQILREEPSLQCEMSNQILMELYEGAVEEAVSAIYNLYACMQGKEELSTRFHRNFV